MEALCVCVCWWNTAFSLHISKHESHSHENRSPWVTSLFYQNTHYTYAFWRMPPSESHDISHTFTSQALQLLSWSKAQSPIILWLGSSGTGKVRMFSLGVLVGSRVWSTDKNMTAISLHVYTLIQDHYACIATEDNAGLLFVYLHCTVINF